VCKSAQTGALKEGHCRIWTAADNLRQTSNFQNEDGNKTIKHVT
jgi:hypothetical protein